MKRSYAAATVALLVSALGGAAFAQHEAGQRAADPPAILASDLIGRPVRSPNGEAVGQIDDLVLSPADRVSSAVLSVGGFLGIGDRRVEVPYEKLVVAANRSTVLVTLSKGQVAAEPDFAPAPKPSTPGGAAATSPLRPRLELAALGRANPRAGFAPIGRGPGTVADSKRQPQPKTPERVR
jgi:sporulation protein YlmC with PRC-barrel domain